jgi:DNA-binding HxlR family transcriptional regulator
METMRTYGDRCGIAFALDLVGERWALLVVRELLLGPKRFTDLQTGLPHASRSVLAQRLQDLEQAALVQRRRLAPPAASTVYELTEWGRHLEGVLLALGRFAIAGPSRRREGVLNVDSQMLHLWARFDPQAADGLDATYELRLGEHRVGVRVAEGEIRFAHGDVHQPDAIVETDPGTLVALASDPGRLGDAIGSGEVRIEGDGEAVRRFLGLFPSPPHRTPPPARPASRRPPAAGAHRPAGSR